MNEQMYHVVIATLFLLLIGTLNHFVKPTSYQHDKQIFWQRFGYVFTIIAAYMMIRSAMSAAGNPYGFRYSQAEAERIIQGSDWPDDPQMELLDQLLGSD